MKKSTALPRQLATLCCLLSFFLLLNFCLYLVLTRRLSNNFSSVSQAKMIDVAAYLPHEETSDLVMQKTDFSLSGELPTLDGAAALVPVYASVIHSLYPEGSVTYESGQFSDDNYYGENFAPDSKMQYHNTVRGYRAIVDGDTDIFFSAAPSEEQKQYAEEQGVELVYVPIGLEAFVFFVNANNPVDSLTVEQVRSIYAGDYTNWNELGGIDRVINPVTRIEGSGSQTMMLAFMKDRPIAKKSPLAFMGAGIGHSFRYYMNGMVANSGVKMLALNGILPSVDNIKNRTYPVVTPFYAIYRKDTQNPNVQALIDWLLSEEGQALIEAVGYVGIR
ncbi:MAG: substrate-binding domain-containing protein [Clostridia bacterium]|nr:substrate-binding domain-containing protein [Clostridia bacterium]